jgi:ATP-dependent Clp protease adaptor protein ClpS
MINSAYDADTALLAEEAVDRATLREIILHNDDVNTFDHVIRCLMEICGHDAIQAEQCAWIVHNNGKCSVKRGRFNDLRPRCEALQDRGLCATIR